MYLSFDVRSKGSIIVRATAVGSCSEKLYRQFGRAYKTVVGANKAARKLIAKGLKDVTITTPRKTYYLN